jgi:hypothetical protein
LRTSLLDVYRTHPLTLFGILCLRWPGILIFLAGWLVLVRDVVTWCTQGGRLGPRGHWYFRRPVALPQLHRAPMLDGPFQGALEFFPFVPLSLVLLMTGWCLRQLAQVWWEVARESASADWTHQRGSAE